MVSEKPEPPPQVQEIPDIPRIQEELVEDNLEEPQPLPVEESDALIPSHPQQSELSIIAEGDESAECSRTSIRLTSIKNPDVVPATHPTQETSTVGIKVSKVPGSSTGNASQNASVSSSVDSFHSASLDPPEVVQQQPSIAHEGDTPAPLIPPHSNTPDISNHTATRQLRSKRHPENVTAPLPEIPPWKPPTERSNDAVTEPLPLLAPVLPINPSPPPPQALDVPLRDPAPPSPKGLIRKASASLFPILPAPLPLRKSMRAAREPSTGMAMGNATPGAGLGGKRSSWLIKAREAKAMEDTGKRMSALGDGLSAASGVAPSAMITSAAPGTSGTLKRKSGDLFGAPVTVENDENERRHKAARLLDGDVVSTMSKIRGITKGKEKQQDDRMGVIPRPQPSPQLSVDTQPPPQSQNSRPVEQLTGEQEGILERLKKTVEGLGARVGKSMGKSLGGVAAASLLAEARAAAEARVAERELGGTPVEPTKIASADEPRTVVHPAVARTSDRSRLSLSDLSVTNEKRVGNSKEVSGIIQAPTLTRAQPSIANIAIAGNESTSTTPPNSPPHRVASFTLPQKPVFNKPSPVFVPPPKAPPSTTTSKDFSFKLPPSSTFALPAPPSSSQPRPPVALSAQSTIESIASNALFDGHEDVPAWMPTTQDTEYSVVYGSQPAPLESQYQHLNELDDDDSWPLDEKLSPGSMWTFGGANKDDSLTWSSVPSQKAETGPLEATQYTAAEMCTQPPHQEIPGAFASNPDQSYEDEYLGLDESELEEMAIEAGLSTVSLVEVRSTLWLLHYVVLSVVYFSSPRLCHEARASFRWHHHPRQMLGSLVRLESRLAASWARARRQRQK